MGASWKRGSTLVGEVLGAPRSRVHIRAIDSDGGVIVLGRVHVLGVQTLSEQAVLLKLLSDKKACVRIR